MEITNEQINAIESTSQRLAIRAVPGSGKTFVLVRRIARQIEKGIDPSKVAVVTFTTAAAREFRERLTALGVDVERLHYCGTIHGLALKVCRSFKPELAVISRELGDELIAEIIERMQLKTNPKAIMKLLGTMRERSDAEIGASAYGARLAQLKAIEIDDLVPTAAELLGDDTFESLTLYVDEYQDTSRSDDRFLSELCNGGNMTIVGDIDQAIYRFRGAHPENFQSWLEDGNAEVMTLSLSFRLPKSVARAADSLIGSGVRSRECAPQGRISLRRYDTPEAEISNMREIAQELLDYYEPHEIAFLSRYTRQAHSITAILAGYGFAVRRPTAIVSDGVRRALAFATYAEGAGGGKLARMEWELENGDESFPNLEGMNISDSDHLFAAMKEYRIPGDGAIWFAEIYQDCSSLSEALIVARKQIEQGSREKGKGITVTTMHGSKGLEWKAVVLSACEEMTIPGLGASEERVSEERRLFYVAMTRTSETLIVTHSETRARHHTQRAEITTPSRFIREAGLL